MDEQSLSFYARHAERYASHRTRPTGHQLTRFLHALPAGARILELGCGNGMDAARMLQLGFDVDATDGTPEMVAEARKRIDHRARLLRFEDIDAEAAYDGVWASASLLHVPAQDLPDILGRIHRALRPGGLFVASYKGGHGEGRDHLGRYYNYSTIDGLERAYRVAGWIDPHLEAVMGSGFDALPTQWLWVTGRRPPG